MITQTINLNLIPDSGPIVVHVDQYDKGQGRLVANLYNGSQTYTPASGAVATIQGIKPDTKGFAYSAVISGSTVTADITEQMTAVAGRVRTQIVIAESGNRTGSFDFILDVQKSALPEDSNLSDSDLILVEQALEAATNAAESEQNASDYASNAKASATSATNSASSANTSALNAAASATKASGYADSALEAATNAAGYAGESEYRLMINPDTGHMALAHYIADSTS